MWKRYILHELYFKEKRKGLACFWVQFLNYLKMYYANKNLDMLTLKAQNVQGLLYFNHGKLTASPVDCIPPRKSLLLCARLLKVKWIRWIPDHLKKKIPKLRVEVFCPPKFSQNEFSLVCLRIWRNMVHRRIWGKMVTHIHLP